MYRRMLLIITIAVAITIGIGTLQDNALSVTDIEKKKIAEEDKARVRMDKRQECMDSCNKRFPSTDDLSRKLRRDCLNNCTKKHRDR